MKQPMLTLNCCFPCWRTPVSKLAPKSSSASQSSSPYEGNILVRGLGPIRSREETLQALIDRPPPPRQVSSIPRHERVHHLMLIRDLHLPAAVEGDLASTIDLLIRPCYRYRDPDRPEVWGNISGEQSYFPKRRGQPASGAAAGGPPGTGKTEAIVRILHGYPQIIHHERFPKMVGPHKQLVWLSIDVPASGRAQDLAATLMRATDKATGQERFGTALTKERRDGMKMLEEWRQVAVSHFLGLLHLDEVQNFFKLSTLDARKKRKSKVAGFELSIVEDQCLKWILNLMNTWDIPLLVSGTPDGIAALTQRLSNLQRFASAGYHRFDPFESATCDAFRKVLLPQLGRYQYLEKPIEIDDRLAQTIFNETAGVYRLIIALWIAAQRVALDRPKNDELTLKDFDVAIKTYMAPLRPSVQALLSKDPERMARYEDLLPGEGDFWPSFWDRLNRQ